MWVAIKSFKQQTVQQQQQLWGVCVAANNGGYGTCCALRRSSTRSCARIFDNHICTIWIVNDCVEWILTWECRRKPPKKLGQKDVRTSSPRSHRLFVGGILFCTFLVASVIASSEIGRRPPPTMERLLRLNPQCQNETDVIRTSTELGNAQQDRVVYRMETTKWRLCEYDRQQYYCCRVAALRILQC